MLKKLFPPILSLVIISITFYLYNSMKFDLEKDDLPAKITEGVKISSASADVDALAFKEIGNELLYLFIVEAPELQQPRYGLAFFKRNMFGHYALSSMSWSTTELNGYLFKAQEGFKKNSYIILYGLQPPKAQTLALSVNDVNYSRKLSQTSFLFELFPYEQKSYAYNGNSMITFQAEGKDIVSLPLSIHVYNNK